MSTLAPTFYRQSYFHRVSRALLSVAAAAIPDWLFNRAFGPAFAAYRVLMRLLYLRFFVPAVLTGDAERIRKVLAVFRVMPHSLVGRRGLEATHDVVRNVILRQIEGAVVECGVARGGSAALMGLLTEDTPGRPLWLFDSYEGLPEPTAEDFRDGVTGRHVRPLPKGSCLGTYETVQRLLFSTFRLSRNRVFMVKGWFQDTLCSQSNNIGDIAVLRIDADWYDSVRCCLEALYDRVLPGGFVVIDDYGSCFGAQRAVDEFLASRQVAVSLVPDGRGGAHFQKPFIH